MNSKNLLVGMVLLISLSLSGCATILSGKTQKINISPVGKQDVKFEIDGQTYTAPTIITVNRENKDKVLHILDPECSQKKVLLNKKINPVFFVNILSGGAFGSTTDYASDAMWEYDSNVNIECK